MPLSPTTTREMRRRPLASAALLALAACGGGASPAADGGGDAGFAVRDSAGVRIAESTAAAWREGEGWRVEAAPSVDLGGEEADEAQQFGGVSDALRLSDGTVVVADELARELRWFAADGSPRARAGRKGSGPGEFTDIHRLFLLPGDTIGAWDANASRLTRFDARGRMADVLTLRPLPDVPSDLVGVLPDGSTVMLPAFTRAPAPGGDSLPYLHVPRGGGRPDTLGSRPVGRQATLQAGAGGRTMQMVMPVPLSPTTHAAVSGDAVYLGDSGRGEVSLVTPDGRVRALIRRPYTPEPVTEAEREAERRRLAGGDPSKPPSPTVRDLVAQIPFPDAKPAFAEMRVAPGGDVWLRAFTPPGEPQAWDVFGADGRLLGRVALPPGLALRQVGRDFVLGTWTDELDVAHVRVHALRGGR